MSEKLIEFQVVELEHEINQLREEIATHLENFYLLGLKVDMWRSYSEELEIKVKLLQNELELKNGNSYL
jgi:hypothetical protein